MPGMVPDGDPSCCQRRLPRLSPMRPPQAPRQCTLLCAHDRVIQPAQKEAIHVNPRNYTYTHQQEVASLTVLFPLPYSLLNSSTKLVLCDHLSMWQRCCLQCARAPFAPIRDGRCRFLHSN